MILVLKNVIGIHFQYGHDFVKNCNAGFVDALLITGNSIFCAADHLSQLSLCISSGFTRFPDAVVIWHGIHHSYLDISANDFWIGDTHTLDVESMGPDGTLHRLYLSAWLDARSGIFTGWYVTANPGSQATLNALRKGIAARGIPLNVYVDNGREFLTYDTRIGLTIQYFT